MMRTALLAILLTPLAASAHGLVIRASVVHPDEGWTQVVVTVAFDDDTPLIGGRVRIISSHGTVMSTATTDDKGVASLPLPEPGLFRITADDGGSHAASIPLDNGGLQDNALVPPLEPEKWVMIVAGLGIIGVLALILRLFLRRSPAI